MLYQILHAFKIGVQGWQFMWILLIIAVFMVAIAIERTYYIVVRSNINARKFMAEIRRLVVKGDYDKAVALCRSARKKALPAVILAGLNKVKETKMVDFRAIQNSVDEGTLEVIPRLQERTGFLAMIGNISTLVGLMGTIYGLIVAFDAVSKPGIDATLKASMLSAGISTAMNTTLTGLAIAVPAILMYTILHNKTNKIIDEIDEYTVKLINLITGRQ